MGYHTEFWGSLDITPNLEPEQVRYLQAFNHSRRMKRDPEVLAAKVLNADPLVGGSFGIDGEFYVGGAEDGNMGQDRDDSILDYNEPPRTQPGLWCQWTVTDDGTTLEWDGGEKFYDYIEWLAYLIENFFVPWGRKLNGTIDWDGEESDDRGKIVVNDNHITTKQPIWV